MTDDLRKHAPAVPAPAGSPAGLVRLHSQAAALIDDALRFCERLESGQAQTPLANHFKKLAARPTSNELCIVVLASDQSHRDRALAWLIGESHNVVAISANRAGLVRIQLQERGFVLESASGHRVEFSQLEDLAAAIRRDDLVTAGDGADWARPLTMRVGSSGRSRSLTMYVPQDIAAALRHESVQVLCSEVDLALLVLQSDMANDKSLRDLLRELPAVLPVAFARSGEEVRGTALSEFPALPVFVADDFAGASFPRLLAEPDDATRGSILLAHLSRKLKLGVDMLLEQIGIETGQTAARLAAGERDLRQLEETRVLDALRQDARKLSQHMQSEVDSLGKALEEGSRQLTGAGGSQANALRAEVGGLSVSDLTENHEGRVVRTNLHDGAVDRIRGVIEIELRAQLDRDAKMVQDGCDVLASELGTKLSALFGRPFSVAVPRLDANGIGQRMLGSLHLEIRQQGERPVRGFLQRLSEGRRMVYVVLMAISLFGGAFGLTRSASTPAFSFALLGLFSVGVVWTFFGWRREEEQLRTKDLARIRENISGEVKRAVGEGDRYRVAQLRAHIDGVSKELQHFLQTELDAYLSAAQRGHEGRRKDLRSRIQSLEIRRRQLETLGRDIQSLTRTATSLVNECGQQLQREAREARSDPEWRQ